MRINLNVPYAENAKAKALGARWDPARKTWYVENPPDVKPLMRWIGSKVEKAGKTLTPQQLNAIARKSGRPPSRGHGHKQEIYQAKMQKGHPTMRTDFSLPDCGCLHVAPWSECEHSAQLPELDDDAREHMRAIAAEC